jgi:hypothetical protein
MIFQGLVFFGAPPLSGWTEKYWLNYPDYTTAALALGEVCTLRLGILHTSVTLITATISDPTVRGDAFPVPGIGGFGTAVDLAGFMPPDYCINVEWQVGVYTRNRTFVRGWPVGEQQDGFLTPSSGSTTALNDWTSIVIANCVFKQTIPNPTPPPNRLVSFPPATAAFARNGLVRRKTGRPFGLPRGRRIAP